MPMIMGFGCSVPAMNNTRTLADEIERIATIRVIPFFSCGAKLPILTGIAGGLGMAFDLPHVDIITYSMYVLGMVVAVVTIILMRKTTLRGKVPPFIMELPQYRMPQFKSTMLHLWDKLKHFIHKAFTIILASTIVIWFLTNFGWDWKYVGTDMDNSILASLGQLIQPLFTPLGFGSQLAHFGWVFAVACVTGLIAKENVIATFYTLACCIITYISKGETSVMIPQEIIEALLNAGSASEDGFNEAAAMIFATGINVPGAIAFIAFNMLTIPCFATVATAKAELTNKRFKYTLLFWIATSYITSTIIYLAFEFTWSLSIIIPLFIVIIIGIKFFNNYRDVKGQLK
jgi:ferrous iron transport protein B